MLGMCIHFLLVIILCSVHKAQITLENKTDQWVVIGVSGVTCGGKTTLAKKLQEVLYPVYIFHQDDYYYAEESTKHVKCDSYDHINYDILSAFDMNKMYDDIIRTKGGAEHKEIDFGKEGRMGFKGVRFLLVEGITLLNFQPISDLCGFRYYFTLSYAESFSRRVLRGYRPDVEGYFEKCVWPEHLKYRAEIFKDKNIKILDGKQPTALNIVLEDLRRQKNTN